MVIINVRGFEQVEGLNYNYLNISSPVTNDMGTRINMVLALVDSWEAKTLDIKSAFLPVEFEEEDEACYIEVPQGFEKRY